MANDEVIGPRKTMFVLVIVVGCFAVLWPRILSPLVLGPTREQIQPNQFDRETGCCEVIFETDVAVLELVNEVCQVGTVHSAAECRKAVNDTCGVDIAVFLKRNENVGKSTKMLVETMQNSNSSCLREHFGVPIYSLGPHLAAKSWDMKDTLKQERAPPIRGMGPHPALRERGRAIPPGPPAPPPASRPVTLPPHIRVRSPLSVYYEHEQPPPIPGMRPPLGSPGGPVQAPKSSMGFVMPIYTICIIVFFVYTLTKIMFRRQGSPYDTVAPDPQFRRRVFRDDSRSSPEKLGKKEADTIVTAISGLVAEVQQQMEASAAPNQQRQDVQDNARPYTNGTILLNSGPVQIVTSEYKEATKEKTPGSVTEKESTPEPKEAEATKVVTEPHNIEDESITGPKEYHPEVKHSSPEPSVTLQECKPTPETVVVMKSSPEPAVVEGCKESSPGPEVAENLILDPLSNLSVTPSMSEIAVESLLDLTSELTESTSQSEKATLESEVFQVSAPESNLNLVEAIPSPEVPKGIGLNTDSEEIASELKESSLELNEPSLESTEVTIDPNKLLTELVEPTAELKTLSPEHKEPISQSKDYSPEFEKLIVEPKDTSLESNEPMFELKEPLPSTKESSPKPEKTLIEPKESSLEPKELSSELKVLSPDHLPSANEPQETPSKPKESIVQPKEFTLNSEETLESEETVKESKAPPLEPKEPPNEIKDLALETKEPLLDSILDSNELPKPEDSNPIHDPLIINPKHQTVTANINQSISEYKESTPELTENSQEVKAPIVECSTEPELTNHSPEIEAPIVECSPETEFIENSPTIEAPIVESIPETKIREHLPDVESESLRLKESTSQSKETTPERKLTEESKTIKIEENPSVPEGTLLDLEEAIADIDDRAEKQEDKESKDVKTNLQGQIDQKAGEELLKMLEGTKAATDIKDDVAKANDQFLQEQRFVLVRRSTPDVVEENKKLHANESKPADDYTLYTEDDEEDLENAAVKVMGMEMTAHPADGSEWPRDERPAPPAAPASPPPRAPRAAEEVKSIFLETEIPQQSRVLVANFQEERPPPAAHAPLVVSGKMTLSLIQDAPRETPERDPESTLDEFTTASAVTQPAAEKGEMESDEEIDEEIEVEEIELEEEEEDEDEEEDEEPPPVKTVKSVGKQ